jgi:exonuclease III
MQDLESKGKGVIIAGDMNCAHQEIDIHSPKTNLKSAGFTVEERNSFTSCYIDQGFVGK